MRVRIRPIARRVFVALTVAALAWLAAGCPRETAIGLGTPVKVADGVQLFHLDDPNLLDPPGPVAVQILRLDPSKVDLRSALARDRVMQLETVPDIAARSGAIAAVNAGFFNVKTGDPAGVLELRGELVSDSPLTRGAVAIVRAPGKPLSLVFDRVSASLSLSYTVDGAAFSQEIDGVDTTRVRGQLMLYTPRFGPDSDMADTGVEWQLSGSPLRVTARRPNAGRTRIPDDGMVLSFGGTVLPTGLERLDVGQTVAIQTHFRTLLGTRPEQWIAGAGHRQRRGPARASGEADRRLVGRTVARRVRRRAPSAHDDWHHAGLGRLAGDRGRPQPLCEPGHDVRRVDEPRPEAQSRLRAQSRRRRIDDDGGEGEGREPPVGRDGGEESQ